uniref:Large ribosomal subunit protein uL6c n=1 Tax=Polysiphonia urceolata TaxID=173545 RepID=A0A1Z1MCA0_POLUR|nr:ribosomal protein L6 [Polysiphonia stricta]ARW63573.1 ribosomal protein L6 [Polysiphonia stricta]
MSRIGKQEIKIPENTNVIIDQKQIIIKGNKGELSYTLLDSIDVEKEGNRLKILQRSTTQKSQALHGLSRSLINNMIIGVSNGFEKKLIINGVGYRAQMDNRTLILNLGYSHIVRIEPPKSINIIVENNTNICVSGISKEEVGEVAATIRSKRPPEPYKGKGIRYENEIIKRKVGKAGK